MKAKVRTVQDVVLTLSVTEAKWLREQMQNPLHGKSQDEEGELDQEMRQAFFEALPAEFRG